MNPDNASAREKLWNNYCTSKNFSDAANFYRKMTTTKSMDDVFWFDLGYSLHELKDYEGAITAYTRSAELKANSAGTYNNRGWAYYCLKQYERAIKDFDKALQINPNYTQAKNNRDACLKAISGGASAPSITKE